MPFPPCPSLQVFVLPVVRKVLKARGQTDVPPDRLEECPICMMFYPLMNTSSCCKTRVCTECFLQARV